MRSENFSSAKERVFRLFWGGLLVGFLLAILHVWIHKSASSGILFGGTLLFVLVPFELPLFIRLSERRTTRRLRDAGIRVRDPEAATALGGVDRLFWIRREAAPAPSPVISELRPVQIVTGDAGRGEGAPGILTGAMLDGMDDAGLMQRIDGPAVFAGLDPGQQLRVLRMLGRRNERVAVFGVSSADLPLMEHAEVSLAVEETGKTELRDSARIVLGSGASGVIEGAFIEARRHFGSLRCGISLLTCFRWMMTGLALLPLLPGMPLILKPAGVVLAFLLIGPYALGAALAGRNAVLSKAHELLRAVKVVMPVSLTGAFAWYRGKGEWDTRALVFGAFVFSVSGLLVPSSGSARGAFLQRVAPSGLLLAGYLLLVSQSEVRAVLEMNALHPVDLMWGAFAGVLSFLLNKNN